MYESNGTSREHMEKVFCDPKYFMDGGKWKRFDIHELVEIWGQATGWPMKDKDVEDPDHTDELTGIIGEAHGALAWLGIFEEYSDKQITHRWTDPDGNPREQSHKLVDALWVDMRLLPYYNDLMNRIGSWDFDELTGVEGFDAQVYILALIQSDNDIDYHSGFVSSIIDAINHLVKQAQ